MTRFPGAEYPADHRDPLVLMPGGGTGDEGDDDEEDEDEDPDDEEDEENVFA